MALAIPEAFGEAAAAGDYAAVARSTKVNPAPFTIERKKGTLTDSNQKSKIRYYSS
jgi:hypothetical protein